MLLLHFHHLKLIAIAMVVIGGMSSSGCQRRAYTDLYVEKMAGEIRELEDRIYEYDAAYRQSEDELDIIRSENEALHQRLSQEAANARTSPLRQRLEELKESRQESITPKKPNSSKPETNKAEANKSQSKKGSDSSELPASPAILPPDNDSFLPVLPKPDPLPSLPPNSSPNLQAAPEKTSPPATPGLRPSAKSPSGNSDLEPPEIDLGIPGSIEGTPFKFPSNGANPNTSPSSSLLPPPVTSYPIIPLPEELDAESISTKQIVLPSTVHLASAISRVDKKESESNSGVKTPNNRLGAGVVGKPEWISPPEDQRVVEIAFHPSLCRGSNRQSDPNEDGLRLVMQPRNQHGEFLSEAAGMTIVITDPERPPEKSKLGRWSWTAQELRSALEPIGVSQGFHVAIAWQSERPIGKNVQVHVRYEMQDGRRLVNEKSVELYSPSIGSDAWTPRVAK